MQSWLAIKDISYNGVYAFITLEYDHAALPENWRGELLEISTQKSFEKVICRGSVYESD
ncbi:hypothetical protein FACS1894170_05630 [Planctomycetales bacterium]|nr:hypothetical protein FACS1894170_05630 [Planctomycetales bacterium]